MTDPWKTPIRVVQNNEGDWEVLDGLDEVLIRESTKSEAVDKAKRWAMGEARHARRSRYVSHVKIHKANGDLQDAWWPPGNRQVSVKPFSKKQLKAAPGSYHAEWERSGYSPPYWAVYITDANGNEDRQSFFPVKDEAVVMAREKFNDRNAKRLSIYKSDWTVGQRHEHGDARRV